MIGINKIVKNIRWEIRKKAIDIYPKTVIDIIWKKTYGYKIDWYNPRDINEKIQWLKLYDSTHLKTQLSDQAAVRVWAGEKIGTKYLIPILGVWDAVDKIDFYTKQGIPKSNINKYISVDGSLKEKRNYPIFVSIFSSLVFSLLFVI